jgi:protein O-mannosyl-transferase
MSNAAEPSPSLLSRAVAGLLRYLSSLLFLRDALLAALTLAALAAVCANPLVNLDDDQYVEHFDVENGLGPDEMTWAFTTRKTSNWHPLTWMSLQLDAQWFGPTPWAFHRTNLILHLANVLLLAEVLRRMTGRLWASAAVAALFAVHPLHVESVAWVSERKDVLSLFFGLLALAAYVGQARRPGPGWLALVALAMAASLLAKPMLVTLPCLLLLLDYWPLGSLDLGQASGGDFPRVRLRWLLLEKVPLLVLAVASCWMTVLAQHGGGALKSLQRFPLDLRVANAVVATECYIGQTFWPVNLAVYYPYPRAGLPWLPVLGAGSLLALVTAGVCLTARSRPYLLVGWFWFLGTLVPVIGLVQVGSQARADRYTYVPLIGLFLMLVWGLVESVPARRRGILLPLLVGVLLACVWLSRIQVSYWTDSRALWEHTLAVTRDNPFALTKYGDALLRDGSPEAAIDPLREAIRLDPRMDPAYAKMAEVYRKLGRLEEAAECLEKAAEIRPDLKRYQDRLQEIRGEQLKKRGS